MNEVGRLTRLAGTEWSQSCTPWGTLAGDRSLIGTAQSSVSFKCPERYLLQTNALLYSLMKYVSALPRKAKVSTKHTQCWPPLDWRPSWSVSIAHSVLCQGTLLEGTSFAKVSRGLWPTWKLNRAGCKTSCYGLSDHLWNNSRIQDIIVLFLVMMCSI